MTEPMLLGAAASFLAGSFGYILFQFWLRPMLNYRRIKHRVAKCLGGTAVSGSHGSRTVVDAVDRPEAIRRLAAELSACHDEKLPDWYRMLLKRRGESPLEAAARMMKLANTRDPEHIARQVAGIRELLKLDLR